MKVRFPGHNSGFLLDVVMKWWSSDNLFNPSLAGTFPGLGVGADGISSVTYLGVKFAHL